ncbi:uncharacterized protein LOC132278899 [Cornus florida]|uniref:uncharacterized protein LOC132278899 n=1 Tax=Cornus florida TaxID=4283 RepID=UPI0028A163EE|nr:uncharacterized protein LOC132278899 [Cornus florida]
MGTLKASNVSSDLQKWQKIFNALVHMLQTQQTQVESLTSERKLLEDRIKLQYDQISQMKRDLVVQDMERVVDAAKSDMVLGLKQREAFVNKLKLEDTGGELADFKEWFHYLSSECSTLNDMSKTSDIKGKGRNYKALENELRMLKSENEKLISKNTSEVSALLSENKFVWNQYNRIEREKTELLRSKCTEIEQANEKIEKLLTAMEKMQSSVSEKDDIIVKFKTDIAQLEADSIKKSEEISRLSRELVSLRKSRTDSVTPVLRRCTAEKGTSRLGGKNSDTNGRNINVKKESYPPQNPDRLKDSEKGCKSSKRKAVDTIPISETAKLFSSTFKVPKLKNSSPLVT